MRVLKKQYKLNSNTEKPNSKVRQYSEQGQINRHSENLLRPVSKRIMLKADSGK